MLREGKTVKQNHVLLEVNTPELCEWIFEHAIYVVTEELFLQYFLLILKWITRKSLEMFPCVEIGFFISNQVSKGLKVCREKKVQTL